MPDGNHPVMGCKIKELISFSSLSDKDIFVQIGLWIIGKGGIL